MAGPAGLLPQVAVLLAGRLVLGDDLGRDPAALFDLKPLRLGPGAHLGVTDAAAGGLAPGLPCPPGGAGDPAARLDVAGQGRPQLLSVLGAQVDLVVRSVQPEKDRAFRLTAVDVIDEERLNFWAIPVSVLDFFRYLIVRHVSFTRRI